MNYETIRGMKYNCKNYIRVLHSKYDLDRQGTEVAQLKSTFEQKEKFDKQTYEWLVGFLKCKNQSDAKKFITNETKKLSERKDITPEDRRKYEQQLRTLSMWIADKKLFPNDLFWRQNMNIDSIKELQRWLGLSDEVIGNIKESGKWKIAEEWKNQPWNDIASYSKRVLEYTLAHPLLVQRGKYTKLGEKMQIWDISLYEEKRRIEKLWAEYLPEQYAVIMTLINITSNPDSKKEFDKYTWLLSSQYQSMTWREHNINDYKIVLQETLRKAISEKSIQTPKPMLRSYQEWLREQAREAEKKIREQVNKDSILKSFEWKTRKEIQENLSQLEKTIFGGEFWQKYARYLWEDLLDIIRMIETAKKAAENDILEDTFWNNIGINRTRTAYLEQVKSAVTESWEKKEIIIIAMSNGTYTKFDKSAVRQILSNPEKININLWQQLVNDRHWEAKLNEFREILWSISAYIDEKPDTNLLLKIDEPRREELRKFFTQKLTEHKVFEFKVGQVEKINHESNTIHDKQERSKNLNSIYKQRLYDRLKNIEEFKVIPEATLKTILQDWKIEWEELYSKLNLWTPNKYLIFERKLQWELNKIINELEKESHIMVESMPDDIKTAEWVFKTLGVDDKSKFQNILKNEIGSLSLEEAQELLNIIQKSERQDNPSIKIVVKTLQNIIARGAVAWDIAASWIRMVGIAQGWEGAVNRIKGGDLKFKGTEWAWRTVGITNYEKARQIRAIEKDPEALAALKKLWHKPEDLDNPIIVIEIQKKVNTLPDWPEKTALLKYIPTIAKITEQQVSAISTIMRNEPKMATEYISSITGMTKEQVQKNIPIYEYLNKHIYKSVEFTNQTSFTESISKMNIGESRSIDSFVSGGNVFWNSYLIELTKPWSYTIRSTSGSIIWEWLTEDQSEEIVENMVLFLGMWFGDLIPYIRPIRDQVRIRMNKDTRIDWKINTQEQFWIIKPLYEKLFGIESNALNIYELDRELYTIWQTPEERRRSVRQKLKTNNLMHEDNTFSASDIMLSYFKAL